MFINKFRQPFSNLLSNFKGRSLLYQSTADPIPIEGSAYCGFDPTAESLHLGNLVSILNLVRLQQLGFKPIAIVGGATVRLGDPSGRKDEKRIIPEDVLNKNSAKIKDQIKRIYNNTAQQLGLDNQLILLDNSTFYMNQNIIQFISEVGRKFRMNSLLNKDHIKQRLDDNQNGLSLTEFFYTILQSYDFAYLNQNYNCTLQIGGSDQWGNITNGCEFVRKQYKKSVYGMTTPLLVDKAGNKFGKSEGNAIWLDEQMSSVNDIRQYLINIPDDQVGELLKMITFLPLEQIEQIMREHQQESEKRVAQLELHNQLIQIIHGKKDVGNVNQKLFEIKDFGSLTQQQLQELVRNVDQGIVYKLERDNSQTLIDLFIQLKFRNSKSDLKRLAVGGGIQINNQKVNAEEILTNNFDKLILNQLMIVKFGKREFKIIEFIK